MTLRPPAENNTSTGTSGNKKRSTGRDREQEAVYGNFFEQRHLDRRLTLLNSEREYAARLIDFSAREMRLHYRRLMQRVAKVKTHLTPMEILRFRHLENQGAVIEDTSRPQSANVIRIAAATRRLQLGSDTWVSPVRSHSANIANRNEAVAREWKARASSAYVGTAPVLIGNKADTTDNEARSSGSNFSSHQALLETTRSRKPPTRHLSCAAEFGIDTNPFETDATNQRRIRLLTREKRCMSALSTSKERFLASCEQLSIPKEILEDPYAHFSKMAAIGVSGEDTDFVSERNDSPQIHNRRSIRESAAKRSERLRREVLDALKSKGYVP